MKMFYIDKDIFSEFKIPLINLLISFPGKPSKLLQGKA